MKELREMKVWYWLTIVLGVFFIYINLFVTHHTTWIGIAFSMGACALWGFNIGRSMRELYRIHKLEASFNDAAHDWVLKEWSGGTETWECKRCGTRKLIHDHLWDDFSS